MPNPSTLYCPACEKPDGLWEEITVPGWMSVTARADERGKVTTEYSRSGHPDREVDWYSPVDKWKQGGCSCGWEGPFTELIRIGTDGRPLPKVHANQMEIGS